MTAPETSLRAQADHRRATPGSGRGVTFTGRRVVATTMDGERAFDTTAYAWLAYADWLSDPGGRKPTAWDAECVADDLVETARDGWRPRCGEGTTLTSTAYRTPVAPHLPGGPAEARIDADDVLEQARFHAIGLSHAVGRREIGRHLDRIETLLPDQVG